MQRIVNCIELYFLCRSEMVGLFISEGLRDMFVVSSAGLPEGLSPNSSGITRRVIYIERRIAHENFNKTTKSLD